MRERIAYFLGCVVDNFESNGSFPVYVADDGIYLRYFDEERGCLHYDGVLLQGETATEIVQKERFRVHLQTGNCDSCAEYVRWLGLEFQQNDGTWKPLILLHESRFALLQAVLNDAAKFLQ